MNKMNYGDFEAIVGIHRYIIKEESANAWLLFSDDKSSTNILVADSFKKAKDLAKKEHSVPKTKWKKIRKGADKSNGKQTENKQSITIEVQDVVSKEITILLVEDDLQSRHVLVEAFKKINSKFEIVEAVNGETALLQFKKKAPDLIFMDINMPSMNGFEASIAIRKLGNGKQVPIIVFTGLTLRSDVKKGFDLAGINDHLSKPVSIQTLRNTIDKWLNVKSN